MEQQVLKEDICHYDTEIIVQESICEDIQKLFLKTSAIKCLFSQSKSVSSKSNDIDY